jgi:hypothetical protein
VLDRVNAPRIAAQKLFNQHPIYGQAGPPPKAPISVAGGVKSLATKAAPGLSALAKGVSPSVLGAAGTLAIPGLAALDTYNTPTEDYYKRFGIDPPEGSGIGSFAKDVGVRGLGFASDLANTLTFGGAGKLAGYRDKEVAPPQQNYTRKPAAPAAPTAATQGSVNDRDDADAAKYSMKDAAAPATTAKDAAAATQTASSTNDKFIDDEVKRVIEARKAQVPLTREAGMAQWKSERDAFGLKDEFGKEQVDRLAALAKQAKQDRDVGLWMSAATGFFAMGAGKSPYALQNFAAGAGIGAEQATKALGAYSKRQSEMNQAQLDIDKARRAEKRGDFESYQNHMQRAEEKAQKSDDNYFNRMTSLVGISQRGQEIKESRLNRQESQAARLDLQRRELQLKSEREFNDSWKDYLAGEGAMDVVLSKGTGPKAAEAKANLAAKEKALRKSTYAMNQNSSSGGGGFNASDIDAEIARRQSKG